MFLLLLCVSGALSQAKPPAPATPTTSQPPWYIPPNQTWISTAANDGIADEAIQPAQGNSADETDQTYIPSNQNLNPSTATEEPYRSFYDPQILPAYNGIIDGSNYPEHEVSNSYNTFSESVDQYPAQQINPSVFYANAYRLNNPGYQEGGYHAPGYPDQSQQPGQTSDIPPSQNWNNIRANNDNTFKSISSSSGYHPPGNSYPSHQPSNISPNQNSNYSKAYDGKTFILNSNTSEYRDGTRDYPKNDYPLYDQSGRPSYVPPIQNWINPSINDHNIYQPPSNMIGKQEGTGYYPGHPSYQPGHSFYVPPNQNWINSLTKDDNVYRQPSNTPGYYNPGDSYLSSQPGQPSYVPPNQSWINPSMNNGNTYQPPSNTPGYYNPGNNNYPSNQPDVPQNQNWINPLINNGNTYQPPPNNPWNQVGTGNYLGNHHSQLGRPFIPSQGNNFNGIKPASWPGSSPASGNAYPAARPGTLSQPVPRLGDIHAPSFQWHVGVYTKTFTPYMQICGGSLVKADVVLSAAHCFWNDDIGLLRAGLFAAAAGKLLRPWEEAVDSHAQRSDVKDIIIPPRFQGSRTSFQDDIAVVMLTSPFEYVPGVKPVCVSFDLELDRRQLIQFNLGTIAGWGLTQPNGQPSQRLNFLKLPYVDIDRCIRSTELSFFRYITSDKICAGDSLTGQALCRGDSGGGLIFYMENIPYIRGIASTAPRDSAGNECNAYAIATFTHVLAHRTFLLDHVPDIAEGCESSYSNGTSGAPVQLLQSGIQGSPNENVINNTDVLEQNKKDKLNIGKNKTETTQHQKEKAPVERENGGLESVVSREPILITKPSHNLQSINEGFKNATTGDRTLQSTQVTSTRQGTSSRQETLATVVTNETKVKNGTVVMNGTVSEVMTSRSEQTKLVTMSVGRGERGVVTVPVDGASNFVCDCFCRN